MQFGPGSALVSLATFACACSSSGGGGGGTGGGGGGGGSEPVLSLSGKSETEMCEYYATRYPVGEAAPSAGGDVASCTPSSITPEGIEQYQRRIAFYRDMYGLPPLGAPDPTLSQRAEECSMMMGAAQQLSHDPDTSWPCYTENGATGAAQSNIGFGSKTPAQSVDGFIFDFGNEDNPGHRRWFLYPSYTGLGFGWFDGGPGTPFGRYYGTCVTTFDGPYDPEEAAMARTEKPIVYPPPGAFPAVMASITVFATPKRVPWSVSWQDADFASATVEMTDSFGAPIALAMPFVPLDDLIGTTAATWLPEPLAVIGDHWHVRIEGITLDGVPQRPVVYEVEFVDCGATSLF